jgi:hypothetical protein
MWSINIVGFMCKKMKKFAERSGVGARGMHGMHGMRLRLSFNDGF